MGKKGVTIRVLTIVLGLIFGILFLSLTSGTLTEKIVNSLIGFSFGCSLTLGISSYLYTKSESKK